jgi:hypothetical protein
MQYEVFLSYTNKDPDKALAEKLFNSLNSTYFPVFRDKDRLTAGDVWDQQLENQLKNSKHLVVLWSQKANQSQWVQNEITFFNQNRAPDGLMIFICLDIFSDVYQRYQSIVDLKEAGIYPDKTDPIELNLWSKVVNKVREAVYKAAQSKPIKRVVFTLTQDRLSKLNNVSQELLDSFKTCYGSRYSDWMPFGSDKSVENILDEFLYVDVNQKTRNVNLQFHWEDIDWKEEGSRLWLESTDNNLDVIDKEIKELEERSCVLALDPFALNDPLIKERFEWCYGKCAVNEQALVMGLSSYPLSTQFDALRKQLRRDARKFYDDYFNPPMVNNTVFANGFAHIIDGMEARRQLQVALRNHIRNIQDRNATFTQAKF